MIVTIDKQRELLLLAESIAEKKRAVKHYQHDRECLVMRYFRGLAGERAVEIATGQEVIEWCADVASHDHPDLLAFGIGVKTHKIGHYPLIEKVQYYPQIICEYIDCQTIDVKGIATAEYMMSHLDDSKIMNEDVRKNGYKSALVYDVKDLIQISDWKKLCNVDIYGTWSVKDQYDRRES